MPTLDDHQSAKYSKILYLGDSSTGKTGSLVSLVEAGYKLRILDMDNGLDSLVAFARKQCPDKLKNVSFETVRDKFKATKLGPTIDGVPVAYTKAVDLMSKWSDGTIPSDWGEDHIFVLDSLSALGQAAYAWADNINPLAKDKRNIFFEGQKSIERVIAMLTSEQFKANVIIITHVQMKENEDTGITRGYANALGSALGPVIPRYFNTMIQAKSEGSGKSLKRTISTVSSAMVDLKNPVPFKLDQVLPLETGMKTIFEKLKEIK
jgi:AAA domain